jgi:hypothetical protein
LPPIEGECSSGQGAVRLWHPRKRVLASDQRASSPPVVLRVSPTTATDAICLMLAARYRNACLGPLLSRFDRFDADKAAAGMASECGLRAYRARLDRSVSARPSSVIRRARGIGSAAWLEHGLAVFVGRHHPHRLPDTECADSASHGPVVVASQCGMPFGQWSHAAWMPRVR